MEAFFRPHGLQWEQVQSVQSRHSGRKLLRRRAATIAECRCLFFCDYFFVSDVFFSLLSTAFLLVLLPIKHVSHGEGSGDSVSDLDGLSL